MILKKNIIITLPAFILLILILSSLPSCGSALKFKNDGNTGNLIDGENGRYYIYCGSYLRAAEIKAEVYAKGDQKEKLHEITGVDPAKWLSENISMGIALLFREQSEEEPVLEDFETKIIHITMSEEITLSIGYIMNREDIDAIVKDYANNDEVPLPGYIAENVTFHFESDKYSGIYYVLQYFIDDKGKSYLYDRWTRRCVPCSYNMYDVEDIENIDNAESEG